MIPDFIRNINGLKLFDRCLLAQIVYLSAQRGYCFAGNEYFSHFFEKSCGTIKRSLKKMEDMGLIVRVQAAWGKRYIYITFAPGKEEEEKEKKAQEKKTKKQEKNPIKYSREGFRFLQKINRPHMPYYHASKEIRLSVNEMQEADILFERCFEKWRKKIGTQA